MSLSLYRTCTILRRFSLSALLPSFGITSDFTSKLCKNPPTERTLHQRAEAYYPMTVPASLFFCSRHFLQYRQACASKMGDTTAGDTSLHGVKVITVYIDLPLLLLAFIRHYCCCYCFSYCRHSLVVSCVRGIQIAHDQYPGNSPRQISATVERLGLDPGGRPSQKMKQTTRVHQIQRPKRTKGAHTEHAHNVRVYTLLYQSCVALTPRAPHLLGPLCLWLCQFLVLIWWLFGSELAIIDIGGDDRQVEL